MNRFRLNRKNISVESQSFRKLLYFVNVQYKGTGFYSTDYREDNSSVNSD